jgi:hypothetical protein
MHPTGILLPKKLIELNVKRVLTAMSERVGFEFLHKLHDGGLSGGHRRQAPSFRMSIRATYRAGAA